MPPVTHSTFSDKKFQKSDRMVSRLIAGEVVLVPLRQNVGELDNIFTLNETGAAVWALLDGRHTLQDILSEILAEYEITESEAAQDLLDLIAQLVDIGAVEKV